MWTTAGRLNYKHVRVEHGVPMALCAQGPAAEEHALRLFRPVDLRRHVGDYSSCALCEVSRANWARASPTAAIIDSQSVKSAEKGGLASTPTAMMRAKKSTARSGTFLSTL